MKLQHPFIIKIIDSFIDNNILYMIFELAENTNVYKSFLVNFVYDE